MHIVKPVSLPFNATILTHSLCHGIIGDGRCFPSLPHSVPLKGRERETRDARCHVF